MSMRPYQRQIAKARMAALGIDRINRRMGRKTLISNGTLRRWMKTRRGRRLLDEIREDDQQNWRRILTGDIAEKAEKAQIKKANKLKRRIRRISNAAEN